MQFNNSVKYGLTAVLFLMSLNIFPQNQAPSIEYVPNPSYSADQDYVDSLVKKALDLKLYDDPYWKKLLHYKVGLLGGRSLIDDKKFFLSDKGKHSTKEELIATIKAFFTPIEKDKTHAGIRFIARFSWLSEKLSIDKNRLPFDFDGRFDKYYESINVGKAIVVFPAGYMGSPASMFGHTLFIFENKQNKRIISPAINYAASTTEDFGPIFAVKGLFGFYYGYFSVMPYSDKINEYNNSEMRDMWEYTLNLSDDEVKRAFKHVVEMDKVGSRYFFLDENCSYNLLFLIDVARPELDLTSGYFFSAEPVDTIRGLIKADLVKKRDYRPSLFSQIMARSESVSSADSDKVINFAKGKISIEEFNSSISQNKKAELYDFTTDYLKFLLIKDKIKIEDYQKRLLQILNERSRVDNKNAVELSIKEPSPPESSHRSRKLSLSGGTYDGFRYYQMAFRPSCHSLIDSDKGLSKGSEIEFMPFAARYYQENKKFKFEKLSVVRVISLSESNRYNVANCYLLDTGGRQNILPDHTQSFGGFLTGGTGFSTSLFNFFQIYGMVETDLRFSDQYKYNSLLCFGGRLGLIFDVFDVWKSVVSADFMRGVLTEKTNVMRITAEERIKISSFFQITGCYTNEFIFKKRTHDISARAEIMF